MFRFNSSLRGMVVDYDSLRNSDYCIWNELAKQCRLLFVTEFEDEKENIENIIVNAKILRISRSEKVFSPNPYFHSRVLDLLGVKTTEIVYISSNEGFICNAMTFMSGVIWITNKRLNYEKLRRCPDLICSSIEYLVNWITKGVGGYIGEVYTNPLEHGLSTVIQSEILVDNAYFTLISLGRYYGYTQYMSQLHPYSSAIFLNKKEGSRSYGCLNGEFAELIVKVINHTILGVNSICTVPVRPGMDDRYKGIISYVANACGLRNISPHFLCSKDYGKQKFLSRDDRRENVKDVFYADMDLSGYDVLLFDDIITTGATVSECVRELIKSGARSVMVMTLAINQQINYWTLNIPRLHCPICGAEMRLLINSQNKGFFYSCRNEFRHPTIDFDKGNVIVREVINQEFIDGENDV